MVKLMGEVVLQKALVQQLRIKEVRVLNNKVSKPIKSNVLYNVRDKMYSNFKILWAGYNRTIEMKNKGPIIGCGASYITQYIRKF